MRRFPMGVALVLAVALVSQSIAVAGDAPPDALSDPAPIGLSRAVDDFLISGGNAVVDKNEIAVANDSANDRYLVVWEDGRHDGTRGTDIWGQFLAGDGAKIGFNFRISGPAATGDDAKPAVTFDSVNNRYLVVWSDKRGAADRGSVAQPPDIYAQRVKPGGNLAGGNFKISGPGAVGAESYPSVTFNPAAGQYLVVWSDTRDVETRGWDVYGRRVKAGGALAGDDFRVSGPAATSDAYHAKAAFNPVSGQYLVVWSDARNSGTSGYDIYGRRVKGGGKLAGDDFRISGAGATSNEFKPAVAADPVGGLYLVVWQDARDSATRAYDVYGRKVKAGGKLSGDDFRISGPAATAGDYDPAVAHETANHRFLVIWYDDRASATRGSEIYGRRVKAGGKLFGGDFRISGSGATDDEMFPALAAYAGCGRFLAVWIDARSGTKWQVYGSMVYG